MLIKARYLLYIIISLCLFGQVTAQDALVDCIVFSYDRPMQLYAFLESAYKYLSGVNKMTVIYRTSALEYENGYRKVAKNFPFVDFCKQSSVPQDDFKPLVLSKTFRSDSRAPYIVYAVDDIIVKDFVDLTACTTALEENKAWGFFLRLGKNISYCYMMNISTPAPQGKDISNEMFLWKFADGTGDWNYPNNVDMTVYCKQDIKQFLETEEYYNPNTLEAVWAAKWYNGDRFGLCFDTSKIINIPMNVVNTSWVNKCNNSYTPKDLLTKFQEGLKIDISTFFKVQNKSSHVDYEPVFIAQEHALP